MEHTIIAVTPAGRRCYLDLLKHYILNDDSIAEWHLWDNCRDEADRIYINELTCHKKIKVIRIDGADGTNRSINRFYKLMTRRDAFYIKMDDDIVFLPPHFGERLYDRAFAEKGRFLWWSPLVINNAICSWTLKHHGPTKIDAPLTAQAACPYGWQSPEFAAALHRAFLEFQRPGRGLQLRVPDQSISLSRFSINCIGLFGSDIEQLRDDFCPNGVDDEEWLSAVLPSKVGRPGRLIGDIAISHYSFNTQERYLITTDILESYYNIAACKFVYAPTSKRVSPKKASDNIYSRTIKKAVAASAR